MADKKFRAKELRGLPNEDISEQLNKLRQELWHNRLKAKEGVLKQMHQIRQARRQIARILTILKEQQLARNTTIATNR